jgi:dolichol-phosphate mannosyltransferase
MILILLIGGLQLFMLGIIGEYLWRTLDQTRQRELFIIDVIVEKNSK